MEYYKNMLAVEAGWLFERDILTKSNYDKLKRSKKINVIRNGCYGTPALISYESLPDRFKLATKEELGGKSPYEVVKTNLVESQIEHNATLTAFFDDYKLSDGRNLPLEKRKEYYADALVLEAIGFLLENKRVKRSSMGKRLKINWDELAEGVADIDRSKYPHKLPACGRRLEHKYRRYKKEGCISLIHKNFLNTNAAKVEDEVQVSFLGKLLANASNYDYSKIAMLYNMEARKWGWSPITPAAVAVWAEKLDLMTYAGRRGSVALSNYKAMQVKRRAPQFPLYYWTMDGWDVELLYQKKTSSGTTYHNRPTVVVVLDACLKYPIGYAVGTHETPELIQQALRNAAAHTAELFGRMYRTQQLQSDRYQLGKMSPYYEVMAEKSTPARAKNAKAKIIEPYFGYINRTYCQMMPNWSGFGITSNKDKQPNVEFLNNYKKHFPDYDGVCKQVEFIMEAERKIDGKQGRFLELWSEMPVDKKIELSKENYLLMFGETTGYRNRLTGSGLNVTIRGQKRHYDCFDLTFRDYGSTEWEIRYDPADLTKVLAVNDDESRRYLLEEKYVQPMALCERAEGDSEQLQRVREFNKQLEQKIIKFHEMNGRILEEASIELPEFGQTLDKLMITDSFGQHKDVRNHERILKGAERLSRKLNGRQKKTLQRQDVVGTLMQRQDAVDTLMDDTGVFREERLDFIKKKIDLSEFIET